MKIKASGPPVAVEQIAEIEESFGFGLPPEYREFLQVNNGGRPSPDTIDVPGLPGSPTDVQEFLGLRLDPDVNNITWYLREMPDCLPSATIPIACDSGGNLFGIVLNGAARGAVIYVDLIDNEVYAVAPTFHEFLSAIKE